jgi:hypothetical protein
MYNVFGLGGYTEVVFDAVFLQVVVEAAHPNVPQKDVGRLEDGSNGAGVVHGEHQSLGAKASGLTGTEPGAEAEDQVLVVVYEVSLGR